jgi:DegV family protein with EDD domain
MSDFTQILIDIEKIDSLEAHAQMEVRLAQSVKNTPLLLPRLKLAGVVDSGALGFYIFASGLTLALPAFAAPDKTLELIQARTAGRSGAPLDGISNAIDPGFLSSPSKDSLDCRYCINMLLELPDPPKKNWKDEIEKLGSSIDTAVGGGLVKLHIHSDDPTAVRAAGKKAGKILEFEFDDMARAIPKKAGASEEISPDHLAVRVVGDSSMSLPAEIQKKLGIYRIENYVGLTGRMVRDCDIDVQEMFARLRSGHVYKTASTSAGEVKDFLDRMMSKSDRLVYVAVGNAYTGTQSLVRNVANIHAEKQRIAILDSRAASGQMGLICLAAARYAAKTNDFQNLIEYVNNQIVMCREYLVIDDLKYLSRTGRIGKIKAAFAGALSVKPIVSHGGDGAVTHAKARSHEDAFLEISKRVADHPGHGDLLVMIEHTDNQVWANEVEKRLKALLPDGAEFIVCQLSSTSAAHMGPGTWGVAVTRT